MVFSSPRTIVENPDVRLSLPADGSVKVQMGNQVVVPLTITPIADQMTGEVNKIAGYEFEVRFKADQKPEMVSRLIDSYISSMDEPDVKNIEKQ